MKINIYKRNVLNHDQELNCTRRISHADHTDANTHIVSPLPYEEGKFEKLVISDTGGNDMILQ